MPRLDEDHSREPRRCRTRGQAPATPREPHADSTVLPGFSATAATDRGRARSFGYPHPGAGGCDSPCAGHARGTEGRTGAASRHPGIAVQVRRAVPSAAAGHPANSGKPRRATGRTAARRTTRSRPRPATRPGGPRVAAGPAPVADRQAGPAPGARQFSGSLIRRWPVTAGAASACARGAGGQRSGRAPGQWRPSLKTREGRSCPRMAREGGRGLPAGAAPLGVPGCGPHPARRSHRTSQRPLELRNYSSRRAREERPSGPYEERPPCPYAVGPATAGPTARARPRSLQSGAYVMRYPEYRGMPAPGLPDRQTGTPIREAAAKIVDG